MADPTQTVQFFDPDGTLRDIPYANMHDALAAGGKPALRFQAPDGKTRYVPADQAHDASQAGGKILPLEQQAYGMKDFYGFTPGNVMSNLWEGAKGIVTGTYDVAKDLVNNPNWVQGPDSTFQKFVKKPSDDQVAKAGAALEKGNRVEAAGHILASALPLVGPWAAGLGEQAGTGDVGGAIAQGVGAAATASAGAKAAELAKTAVPKGAGLVKAGSEGLVKSVGAQVAPTPTEAMTTALTRGQLRSTKGVDMAPVIEKAMPDLKAAEATSGKPTAGVDDLITNVNAAKKAVWNEYQQKLEQAKAVDAGPLQTRDPRTGQLQPVTHEPTINGGEIADAMMGSIDKRQATLNPGLTDKVKAMADTYRRPMTLGEAEDFLQSANNDLHTYYAKNKVGRRVALGDPDIASTVAEADQLRTSLYSKLDELTGPGAAEIKQRYGALSTVEEAALRARATQARQSPESLSEQLSKAAGAGKVVAGVGATLMGHPAGLAYAGEGVMQAGLSKWLKGRQTTDALIKNSFENYGKPQSAIRAAITGTRGEAGAPGTVQEEEPVRPEPAPDLPQSQRRTPQQVAADIAAASRRDVDPQMQALEAQRAQRAAAFTAQRQALGQIPVGTNVPLKEGTTPSTPVVQGAYEQHGKLAEQPDAPTFYSKAEKAAQTLPGSGTGQQMLSTLRNQGVKPGELEQLGVEDFLKSKAKFSRQEVADFVAKNKLQVGEKDLKTYDPGSTKAAALSGVGTKYESYTLPGEKQNYTERLFTYDPKSGLEPTSDPYEQRRRRIEEGGQQFQSSHWDEPNVLAHARFDERMTSDGKKALFLEEAQSDWHQKGKKEGYQSGEVSPFEVQPILDKVSKAQNMPSGQGYTTRNWTMAHGGKGQAAQWLREGSINQAEFDKLVKWGSSEAGVPDAPFKTDWHELVMKRMLREAAERGADRLAWTTGDQQAERYALSKQVGKIYYYPGHNNLLVYDKAGSSVIKNIDNVPKEKLADYVGKDGADKLLKASTDRFGGQKLEGEGLKIGGEWAKALYDRAIPNFLNKYAKKWGARVGENDVNGQKVHSIEITPALKKAVLKEGQPIASAKTFGDERPA